MSQGPIAMPGAEFGPFGDENMDDLPRTFRREREAREREARERAAAERAAAPSLPTPDDYAAGGPQPQVYSDPSLAPAIEDMPYPASVRRFDVPFLHLVGFFLKAVIAAIPALILLTVILWFAGAALQALFPELVKMKILIGFQN